MISDAFSSAKALGGDLVQRIDGQIHTKESIAKAKDTILSTGSDIYERGKQSETL